MINTCLNVGLVKPKYYYNLSGFFVGFQKGYYSKEYLNSLGLNKRQKNAILHLKIAKKITNKKYQEINKCSRNTVSKDLTILVKKEILSDSGIKGASAFYSLRKSN